MPSTRALRCLLCALHLVVLSQALNSFLSSDGSVLFQPRSSKGDSASPSFSQRPKKQAGEEAAKKAEDEAKKKAEEEAKKKAGEEAAKKTQDEAKKKAEGEASGSAPPPPSREKGEEEHAEHEGDQNKTVNIHFGGPKFAQGKKHVSHPELVKSMVCGKSLCKACKGMSDCWHGGRNDDEKDTLNIKVAPNAAKTADNYVAEVWARCSSGGGEWQIQEIKGFLNGVLSIYVDKDLVREVTPETLKEQNASHPPPAADIEAMPNNHKPEKSVFFPIPIQGDSKARIRIVFRVQDPSQIAEVSLKFEARHVDAMVEECMSVKNCLENLGDGSEAGFLLRNNNMYQLACLQGNKLPVDVQAKCVEWMPCMSDERQLKLKTFLEASQGKEKAGDENLGLGGGNGTAVGGGASGAGNSLGEDGMLVKQKSFGQSGALEDPVQCIDPDVDDTEAFECECLSFMESRCGGIKERCFRRLMCTFTGVCAQWKRKHCRGGGGGGNGNAGGNGNGNGNGGGNGNGNGNAMTQRAAVSTSSTALTQMDNSLRGKCAA